MPSQGIIRCIMRLNQTPLIVLVMALLSSWGLSAQVERIPLKPLRLPPQDLVLPGHGPITPEEAFERQLNNQLDLSELDPYESEIWRQVLADPYNPAIDQLAPKDGDRLLYAGALTSQSGMFRFNAEAFESSDRGPYIVVLDKNLHGLLLRRNLLRKLGYQIPAIQYHKELVIEFETLEDKERFLTLELPRGTFGTPKRWVTQGLESDDLSLTLQDIALTRPSETDHYNVAFGVPPRTLQHRVLRSLIVPYALLDIRESANKLEWTLGRIENDHILLPHFTLANMNATYEDARWMARRLLRLSEADLREVVREARFPREVEELIYQKLLSRRNSLRELFNLQGEFSAFTFDPKISLGDKLVDGQLTQEDWPGYASRFAHGAPDSPFQDYGWYLFSEAQSIVLDELVSRVNERLSAFDLNEARFEYAQEEFRRGLEHFIETGEFLEQEVGTWFSPTLDGQLILSRNIVIGNYMGTDNMVQKADTFGFSVRLGGHLGIEGLPNGIAGSVGAGVSVMKTYTHIKPVKTLKESVKEPYQNMIVPFVKATLKKRSEQIRDLLDPDAQTDEELKKELEELFAQFNEHLGVGESLIITQRITPNVMVSGRYSMLNTRFSLNLDGSGLTIKRLHLYRKDQKTLQVYRDNGRSISLAFTMAADHYIPILKIQSRNTRGAYDVKLHNLNLELDLERNPELASQMNALSLVLKNGSAEVLEEVAPPTEISSSFTDKSTRYALFHWRSSSLKQNDRFQVRTAEGAENHFFRRRNTFQSGLNYRAFLVDVANYFIGQYLSGVRLSSDTWRNPGQTSYGVSHTIQTRFEASLDGQERFGHQFLNISHRHEGWKISVRKLQDELQEINERFGRVIFPLEKAYDATNLKLFSINVDLNIFEEGVRKLTTLSNEELRYWGQIYRRRYGNTHACRTSRSPHRNDLRRGGSSLIKDEIKCGNFNPLINLNNHCKEKQREEDKEEVANCLSELARKLENNIDFDDFVRIIGEENMTVNGAINGFRESSEVLVDTIRANTFGEAPTRFTNGPIEAIRAMLGLQSGEFNGTWMREHL